MTAVINYNVAKSQDVNKPWWKPFPKKMKLGAAYNLFDGEELLEASILSIKQNVDYVCVVYQETSNFGIKCNESLLPCLFKLRNAGLIDELIPYIPKTFSLEEKKQLVSSRATGLDLGGATPETISDTFFNEMTKREMGRLACEKAACTHFMSMDTDEFYLTNELFNLKQLVQKRGYEGVLAKMRYFFKYPECELLPLDEEEEFKAFEIAERLKLQLKKLELIRLLSDQMLQKNRLGVHIFTRGMKGGIKSIYTSKYDLSLYELLKTYANLQMQKSFQTINIPKLPVFTTEEGIKRIKRELRPVMHIEGI